MAVLTNLTDQSRLRISLLLCRIGVAIIFALWAYDKLKVGLALPGTGTSDNVMRDFYGLDLPPLFFTIVGIAHIGVIVLLLAGLYKRAVRSYLLALAVIPFLLPKYWQGLWDGLFVVPHPTILFYSATAFCACAFAVYALRDYDTLWSRVPKRDADFSDAKFRKTLGLVLFFCRLAVFIVFMVWVYSKIEWPERGVTRMRTFWLIPSFPSWGVLAFAWAELVICFIFLFGFFKRATAGFFVILGLAAVFTPRAMGGMKRAITEESWHTILYYPGFCLLICAIIVYLLRDFDTRFTLSSLKKNQEQQPK